MSALHRWFNLAGVCAVLPPGWLIRGMRRVRLAWNVVEITPERQQQKLAV